MKKPRLEHSKRPVKKGELELGMSLSVLPAFSQIVLLALGGERWKRRALLSWLQAY